MLHTSSSSQLSPVDVQGRPSLQKRFTVRRIVVALATLGLFASTAWSQSLKLIPTIVTAAGTGTAGHTGDGGPATAAELYQPGGVAFDSLGNVYVADYANDVIRKINASGVISTIAGTGTFCPTSTAACGDGGPAASANLGGPYSIALDLAGNVYFTDQFLNRIRKITASTGIITTVVGSGNQAPYNTNVPALLLNLNKPDGIGLDSAGNIFVSDSETSHVYKLTVSTNIVTTIADNTAAIGYSGNGGPGANALINQPLGIAVDTSGNVYFADQVNNVIREVLASNGYIYTVVGTGAAGYTGDGGAATSATLNAPRDVAFDGQGNLLIADTGNTVIREVNLNTTGIITTLAGSGTTCPTASTSPCGDNGPATSGQFSSALSSVHFNPVQDTVYITDLNINRLRELVPYINFPATQVGGSLTQNYAFQVTGAATTITGFTVPVSEGSVSEYTIGTITGCNVNGSALNAVGTICTVPITFTPGYAGLRKSSLAATTNGGTLHFGLNGTGIGPQAALSPGTMSTVAGTGVAGYSGDNTAATSAKLNGPTRTAIDAAGNVYIADTTNNVVREVVAGTGKISTVAGSTVACVVATGTCGDGGSAVLANLAAPASVALDGAGNLYIADTGDNRIRKVDANTGIITTVAGDGGATYAGDGGQATSAAIGSPQQVIADLAGNLYIAAAGDNAVRFVSANSGLISTLAGSGTACATSTAACGDNAVAAGGNSQLNNPTGLALDPVGDLYIADSGDNRIRRVDATTGVVTTVVGTGTAGFVGDGGQATAAELSGVHSIDLDAAGDMYLADTGNSVIRMVSAATGTISTVVGNEIACASATAACGDTLLSNGSDLIAPKDAALDSLGNLYIADSGENRVREVSVSKPTFTFASTPIGSTSSDSPQSVSVKNIGNAPLTLKVPATGTNPAITGNYSIDSTSSCPQLTATSTAQSLPAGSACTYAVDFTPLAVGTNTGTLVGTDNSLNAAATQTVNLTGTGTQSVQPDFLTTSNTTPAYGVPVTFTDTVPVINGITPTGYVVYFSGTTQLGYNTIPASGIDTFTTTALPAGTDSVTAIYYGDSNYGQVTSNAVIETVGNPANTATTTTLTSSVNPTTYGQSTTLTATVGYPNGGAVPTGSVTFYAPGTPTVVNLQATPTSTTFSQTLNLPAGTYSVSILGNTNGGLYVGWNPAYNPSTNNRWTDRYGIEMCGTCTPLVNDIAGDPGASTDAQALSAFLAAATFNMTVNSLVVGQTVNNPYTFTLTSPQSVSLYVPDGNFVNGAFTETSSFADDTGGLSLAVTPLTPIGTGNLNSSGVATLATSAQPVGTDPIQAVYSGNNTYVASSSNIVSQVVNKATSTGVLSTSNASPTVGQSVTLTDTLPPVNGTVPTGTVTFYSGTTSLGTGTITNGVATLATTALPTGTDSVTAVYGGDGNFVSSTSNAVAETVATSSAADVLTTSNVSPSFGQSVSFTDTIPVVAGLPPTGTVTFYSGTTVLGTGTVSSSGVATLSTGGLPTGSDSITAVYGGDGNYAPVTSNAVTESVSKTTPTLVAPTVSPANAAYGTSVTINQTVPAGETGTVTFYNGTTVLGTGTINNGVATLTTTGLPAGTDSITTQVAGDGNYNPATSPAVIDTVSKATTTLTAPTVSPSNAPYGTSVTITQNVPTDQTGTVNFYSGTTLLGTGTISNGVATLITTALPVGTDSVTAQTSGDGNYSPATSPATSDTVGKASPTLAAPAVSPANAAYGTSVTITQTVPVGETGTVTFYNGTTVLGTGTISNGTATYMTTALPAGAASITGHTSGDGNYNAQASPATVDTVGKVSGTDTLTTSNAAPNYGQSVTLTDTIPIVNGVAPTGLVTFFSGTTSLGTGSVNASGVATLTTTALPVGTDSITANYPGDGNYAQNTAGPLTETVGKSAAADTLTTSNASPSSGQIVTFTDTIPLENGVVPTGLVTFYSGTNSLGTSTINSAGVATLSTAALAVGADSITAVYPGDGNYAQSTAGPITENVAKSSSADTLTTSNASINLGQSVTFTDTIPVVGANAPTGTVTFYSGTTSIGTGTVNSAGIAILTTTSLPAGTLSITATYPGDSNYSSANAGPLTETVAKAGGADTLSSSIASPSVGQSVTFTDTIPVIGGIAPTGTVTFYNGATVIGTGTVSSTGVATLTYGSLPAGTDTITAVYGGDGNYGQVTSNPISETVGKSSGADTLTSSNLALAVGQAVTFTDIIPVVGGIAPTGTVTFYDGSISLGTGTVSSSGIATLVTSSLPAGTDSITAVYGGDSNYGVVTSNAVTETVAKATETDTLASSNPTPTVGQMVTFTDTLPIAGGIVPTGTVTFYDGTIIIGTGTVNSAGVATLTTGALPAGTDQITAVYPGDNNYAGSTAGPVAESVTKATSADTLQTSNPSIGLGQSVTFTATVPVVGGIPPTGTVTFYDGNSIIGTGTLNSSGVAMLMTSTLPAGSDQITAVYPGDGNYNASNAGPLTETVGKANGADTLTASTLATASGQPVTLTDTIPVVNGLAPTGTVTFYDGTTVIGTGTVSASGVATLTTGSLPPGADVITAVYSGDGNYASVTANPVTVTVSKTGNADVLTTSNATPTVGQPVTFTDTITKTGSVVPTGTVTFYDGTTVIGTSTVNASGVATLTTGSLPAGTDTITAVYSGDATYASATSNPVVETVSKSTTVSTLTTSNPAINVGQTVTFTDTIKIANGVGPTGTVTFYDGTTIIGTGTVNASGVATLTTGSLPAGTDVITAVYAGDAHYDPATTAPVTEVVAMPPTLIATTTTLTASPASTIYGQAVTLTDTITAAGGIEPTGTVTFYDGPLVIGTGTVNASGVATLTTTTLPVGSDTITAVYSGDTIYAKETSNAVKVTVAAADFTIAATPPTQTINPGDTVSYTIALGGLNTPFNQRVVLSAVGLPPGATVSFSPASLVPGAGPTTTKMTIVTSPLQAMLEHGSGVPVISFALLLLPMLGVKRFRKQLRKLPKGVAYSLAILAGLGAIGTMTGCGGGYFGNPPQTYTIIVTGTSGNLEHSTTVTLTVR